jgi:Chemotaxis protein histidine kinase and related kinases
MVRSPVLDEHRAATRPYLIFRSGKEEFAVPSQRVLEIHSIRDDDGTQLAAQCIVVRGQSIPIVSCGSPSASDSRRQRRRYVILIAVRAADTLPRPVALLADRVSKVVPIPINKITALPENPVPWRIARVRLDGRFKHIIDPDRLVVP